MTYHRQMSDRLAFWLLILAFFVIPAIADTFL